MGKRGPAPQPKAHAIAKGVYRPSRHEDEIADSGLQFLTSTPAPIGHLNEIGLRVWNEICESALTTRGWIAKIDLPLLEAYCYNVQMMYEFREIPKIEETKQGRALSPEYRIFRDSEKMIKEIGVQFGIGPSSRTRIKLEKPEDVDEFTKFQFED